MSQYFIVSALALCLGLLLFYVGVQNRHFIPSKIRGNTVLHYTSPLLALCWLLRVRRSGLVPLHSLRPLLPGSQSRSRSPHGPLRGPWWCPFDLLEPLIPCGHSLPLHICVRPSAVPLILPRLFLLPGGDMKYRHLLHYGFIYYITEIYSRK